MIDLEYYVALRNERDELAERVRQLEAIIRDDDWLPRAWRLTPTEAVIVNIMVLRACASREALHQALYGADPDGGPDIHIVDVQICHLRRKLRAFGIAIETVRGRGFRLDDTTRLNLAQLRKEAA